MTSRNLLDIVEHWHNRASDTNFVWFPFLPLKLQPHEIIDHKRTLVMTVCFSCYFNAAFLAKKFFLAEPLDLRSSVASQAYFFVGFLLWFNGVTRPLWNRRAARLKSIGGAV
jgi:hypothetical protein